MRRTAQLLVATATLLSAPLLAAPPKAPSAAAEAQVLELSKQAIALRSVQGEGNKTAEVAKLYKQALLGAGWGEKDIEITPVDDTAYLVATWQGSDPKLKPLVISGHMDVVEANPKDWTRDPFTPVVENGYLYGRGASDQKFSEVLAMVGLMELRKGGFKPKRTIVIAFSGDEETTMKTTKIVKNVCDILIATGMQPEVSYHYSGRLYGRALAAPRKRPRRIEKKIAARYGYAHHVHDADAVTVAAGDSKVTLASGGFVSHQCTLGGASWPSEALAAAGL